MPPEMPTPTAAAGATSVSARAAPSPAASSVAPSASYRYAWVFLVGTLGYLAISAKDTSVMLIDCAKMLPIWRKNQTW